MSDKIPVLVFDMNGTLLDTGALRPHFERIFGTGQLLDHWFNEVLLYSQSLTLARDFIEFGEIARGALRMLATARGTTLQRHDMDALIKAMQALPPFAEVPQALRRLHDAGFRLVVLTNSSTSSLKKQVHHAAIADVFEEVISVDEVKKYKPSPDTYRWVADELDLRTRDLLMVAAHPWDLIGARNAGCGIAFLRRPGTAWIPITEPPDFTAPELDSLASQLIAKYS